MLHALIYTSQAEPAFTDAELELVLIKSRALNSMRGITGALLKRDRHIVQYLEGAPEAIERTFARIVASPLHRDVAVVARTDDVPRIFDRWHMGFRDFQPLHSRGESTEEWEGVLDHVRRAATDNAPARRLLEQWDSLAARTA